MGRSVQMYESLIFFKANFLYKITIQWRKKIIFYYLKIFPVWHGQYFEIFEIVFIKITYLKNKKKKNVLYKVEYYRCKPNFRTTLKNFQVWVNLNKKFSFEILEVWVSILPVALLMNIDKFKPLGTLIRIFCIFFDK